MSRSPRKPRRIDVVGAFFESAHFDARAAEQQQQTHRHDGFAGAPGEACTAGGAWDDRFTRIDGNS